MEPWTIPSRARTSPPRRSTITASAARASAGAQRSIRDRAAASIRSTPDMWQDLLAEQTDLLQAVLAPQLEHHMRAAGVLVLLDRSDAVYRRACDRLALVEDRVGDLLLRRKPSTGFHRLRNGAD